MAISMEAYKKVLHKQIRDGTLSEKTARSYISCMENLCEQLKGKEACTDIADAIHTLCTENEQTPKYIAAVKKYERDVLDAPKSLLYGQQLQELRRERQKPIGRALSLEEKTYVHKINALRNQKLKLALRIQVASGLRIFEVANLLPTDFEFQTAGKITITVREGKGGKMRKVDCEDAWLSENLKKYIAAWDPNEAVLFYKESYLKKKAGELGLLTHDLRRLNAKQRYREKKAEGESHREARRAVQKQLGHAQAKITDAYIGSG